MGVNSSGNRGGVGRKQMGTREGGEEVGCSHQQVQHTGGKEGEVGGRQGRWQSPSVRGGKGHAPP